MSEFKQYRRKRNAELRPYVQGENMDGISVSDADAKAGSPKAGDMIARNPENHEEQWLVAAQYFADHLRGRVLALSALGQFLQMAHWSSLGVSSDMWASSRGARQRKHPINREKIEGVKLDSILSTSQQYRPVIGLTYI